MSLTREQLLERKHRLGASESAAALGLSPYLSPLELWQDKIADEPVQLVESEFMEWGVRLEAAVLRKYCENNSVAPIEAPAAWRVSEKFPWLGCTPDAVLADRLVEVKTASSGNDWGAPGTDEIPAGYVIQCTHQMIVTGATRVDVAVLISGHDYREYQILFDATLAEMLVDRTWAFWRHVMTRTPPDVHSIADAARRWPRHTPGAIQIASNEALDAFYALREVKAAQERLEFEAETLGVELRKAIGDAEGLADDTGKVLCTWKTQSRVALDVKTFKQAEPELFARYAKQSESRVFRLASE